MRMLAGSEPHVEVAMTPIIDMMFLLLIFFLVSTAFIDPEKDQKVKLPEVDDGSAIHRTSDEIIVNIRRGGVLVIGGRITTVDDLEEKLIAAGKKNPKQVVKVRGAALTYHKHVVRVLEACSKAKITNISIVAKQRR